MIVIFDIFYLILFYLILSYLVQFFFYCLVIKNSKVEIIDKNKKNEKKISPNVEREVERNRERKK